ncbi:hypothetical protein Godav_009160 [Gossypium davidsonii]|uniref:Hydroxyproline-rich glycoprotein family protein n=2 Tax=Gossypium TaxID=3633 RepID=A0A7J8SC84_GOSDV|nr:hypothetical protein [Gossypium davidsonii]MBA0659296.1 hypothetical protein [Gossypium klotzschianum]
MMKNEEMLSSTRPLTIGFPLGFAFLLILLFCISGFVIGCVNWDKLRALILQSSGHDHDDNDDTRPDVNHAPVVGPAPLLKYEKAARPKIVGQSLPVLMPGDEVPRFVAMACPCEPPTIEKIKDTVQKPPPLPVPFLYS